MVEKLKWIYKKEILADLEYFFLIGSVLIFTVLRIPSLVEPDWYGDEGIYQVIGRALNSGRLLYKEIWDNKPPVLYVYYAAVNGDLFLIRMLSLIIGALSVVVFFFVARLLFQGKKLPLYISTFIFAILFGLPIIEGNIANAENFMLLPVLLSLYFILKLKPRSFVFISILSGFFLSIAFLTKTVAFFDLLAFTFILFILRFKSIHPNEIIQKILKRPIFVLSQFKQEGIIIVSFIIPILFTFIYFAIRGALTDFSKAVFLQNVGYVGYANYFLIPQGLLIFKIILLLGGLGVIFYKKNSLNTSAIVIYIWVLFSSFNAFFSGRPYTHYVLVLLPSFCLLIGLIFFIKKYALLNITVVILLLTFIRMNFTFYTKITDYYQNYISFIMGEKDVRSYQAFFDSDTPRNYEIANFIKTTTNKNESIFILSDSSTIYYLADKLPPGRYIVEYHIGFYKDGVEETKRALDRKNPKYMIVTKERLLPNFSGYFTNKYTIQGVTIYEQ